MCGVAGAFGPAWGATDVQRMIDSLRHRGPDAEGLWADEVEQACLGHTRLSIIDLSEAGRQPMSNAQGTTRISFNGEIYNYLELRRELSEYPFRTQTDTEVVLAAYDRWGIGCLDHFIGMFAFVLWDSAARKMFAARDRFGVKPLYYTERNDGSILLASEIGPLLEIDGERRPDATTWATYLVHGMSEHDHRTFWEGIAPIPAGHYMLWSGSRRELLCWYDLATAVRPEDDHRPLDEAEDEYASLLEDSVRLRFRSDVPVGINLSGGLDSSVLLGTVKRTQNEQDQIAAFTFVTGDPLYDELPWVSEMLAATQHPSVVCRIGPNDIRGLAASTHRLTLEPFGGIPTLAYARLFERAAEEGVVVLLDGQGLDEQWAGYDYYRDPTDRVPIVQGSRDAPVRPGCLAPEFAALASPPPRPTPFGDRLRNLQYRDARVTKIPRALRYNDRVSMRSSRELREPFLDHRLFELALAQPADRKIRDGISKWMLRRIAHRSLPGRVVEAPKRPLQTPQREWLRGPLRGWTDSQINVALNHFADWLVPDQVRASWSEFLAGSSDNSFYIWQWVSLGLIYSEAEVTTRG
jgi:asparagine synthase (glutamine-hydrolysing)